MGENREKTDKQLKNLKRDAGPGRPKGQRNFQTIYKEALKKIADLNELTPEELEDDIIAKGVSAARKGDYRFYKDLLDRLDGQAVKRTDLTSGGKPLPNSINVNFSDFGDQTE